MSIISGVTYLHVFYLQTKPPVLIRFKRSYYYCDYTIYYTHFEITGGPCNLIGSN